MSDQQTTAVSGRLNFDISSPAELVVQVAVATGPGVRVEDERFEVPTGLTELPGPAGSRQHLIRAFPGRITLEYSATARRLTGDGPAPTEADRVVALRPSRYCPSDKLNGFAQAHFGTVDDALARTRAIREYVHRNIAYTSGSSGPTTDAADTLLSGQGVCRDFAHLVVALCRAVGVPARVAAVYAPGLSPMDFHLVVETALDGVWRVWDATRLAPRQTLIRIATGRDAADTALATTVSGLLTMPELMITAVAAGDLPFDDHTSLVSLA